MTLDTAGQLPRQMIEAALTRHPEALVAATISLWRQLAPELILIIGEGGFKALYARSMRLASVQFSWLKHEGAALSSADPFEPLRQRLETRDLQQATDASIALFTLFFDTLASLIGEGLTTHLLQDSWSQSPAEILRKDVPQ